jgi:hypothetical protein
MPSLSFRAVDRLVADRRTIRSLDAKRRRAGPMSRHAATSVSNIPFGEYRCSHTTRARSLSATASCSRSLSAAGRCGRSRSGIRIAQDSHSTKGGANQSSETMTGHLPTRIASNSRTDDRSTPRRAQLDS